MTLRQLCIFIHRSTLIYNTLERKKTYFVWEGDCSKLKFQGFLLADHQIERAITEIHFNAAKKISDFFIQKLITDTVFGEFVFIENH